MQYLKIALALGVMILFFGCAPKIVSMKSPMNTLQPKRCFTIPSKEVLSKSPIYEQKLYQLTQNSLKKYDIDLIYKEEGNCNNYLLTNWVITTSKEIVTEKGDTYTSSYGTIHGKSYSEDSYSYTTPGVTYEDVSYNRTYSLEIGQIKNGDLLKVWQGTQSRGASSLSLPDAQKITNDDQPYIDDMIKQMLIENNLITSTK